MDIRCMPFPALLALSGLVLATPAAAGTDSGFYAGAAVGRAYTGDVDVNTGSGTADFDGDDTGWKLIAGYNLGLIPFVDLAVEGGYVDFGTADENLGGLGSVELEADGFNLFGVAGAGFGPVGIFAKLGLIDWDADIRAAGTTVRDDGTDPAYGVGVRFALFSLQIRGEYEFYDIDAADDISLLSIGALWTF